MYAIPLNDNLKFEGLELRIEILDCGADHGLGQRGPAQSPPAFAFLRPMGWGMDLKLLVR